MTSTAHDWVKPPSERQEQRQPRIPLIPFNEIRLGTKRRYLVKGLIPREGLVVAWGPPKCGKSFWTYDLSMHIALGWEYRGRRVQQGPVVYCAFEGAEGFKARVEAWRQRHLSEAVDDVPFYLEPMTLDLVADRAELITAIKRQLGDAIPAAVILDTLNRSLRGSENSDQDMSAYVRAADAIREAFNCAVIIVHHCGLEGTRPRGHTSLSGAADAQLSIKRDQADNIITTVEMAKDGPQGDTIVSRLETVEVGTDEDGDVIGSCCIEPVEDGDMSKAKVRTTGATKIALDLLHRAIADAGEKPPASNHIPADIYAVRLDLWRSYCYEGAIAGTDTPEARQKAFSRASQKLQALGAIGKWGNFVWAT